MGVFDEDSIDVVEEAILGTEDSTGVEENEFGVNEESTFVFGGVGANEDSIVGFEEVEPVEDSIGVEGVEGLGASFSKSKIRIPSLCS